jgi:hypothetical protein
MRTAERLNSLMEHLRLEAALFATQVPGDVADLAWELADRIKGLVLCVPMRLDARPFERVAPRLLMISGETGLSAQMTRSAQERLPEAQRHILEGYNAEGWSDVVADRTAEVAGTIIRFLTSAAEPGTSRAPLAASSGTHAGLTYRIEGQGPALILLPFFLAPSQWEPALPELIRHFTVIQLGGPHIGGVAALEDRARAPTYQAMFRTLVDLMAPEAGSRILDVGCGSGALDRLLAAGSAPPLGSMRLTSIPSCCARPLTSQRTRGRVFGSHREARWRCRLPIRPSIASSLSPCSRSATPTRRSSRWCASRGRAHASGSSCAPSTYGNGGTWSCPPRSGRRPKYLRSRSVRAAWRMPACTRACVARASSICVHFPRSSHSMNPMGPSSAIARIMSCHSLRRQRWLRGKRHGWPRPGEGF